MEFLVLALQCSFLPVSLKGVPTEAVPGPAYVVQAGTGVSAKNGDRVTLDYWIKDANGKEIANSDRRGIPFTFNLLSSSGDSLLSKAAVGVKAGEERVIVLFPDEDYGGIGPNSFVKVSGPLIIRVKVSQVDRR